MPIKESSTEDEYRYVQYEIKTINGDVYWRINREYRERKAPPYFETQYGLFDNFNMGEFTSAIRMAHRSDPLEEEIDSGKGNFYISGNFCDMFDCGRYSFAISSLTHLGMGLFKIVRIDENLTVETMYDNELLNEPCRLEYGGKFKRGYNWYVIAIGIPETGYVPETEHMKIHESLLFKINDAGECKIVKTFFIDIPSHSSYEVVGDYIYYGHNGMVSRLDLVTEIVEFFCGFSCKN